MVVLLTIVTYCWKVGWTWWEIPWTIWTSPRTLSTTGTLCTTTLTSALLTLLLTNLHFRTFSRSSWTSWWCWTSWTSRWSWWWWRGGWIADEFLRQFVMIPFVVVMVERDTLEEKYGNMFLFLDIFSEVWTKQKRAVGNHLDLFCWHQWVRSVKQLQSSDNINNEKVNHSFLLFWHHSTPVYYKSKQHLWVCYH